MSNLIPTPIVDKNGVPSIRHKKPASSSVQANLPAPNMSALLMNTHGDEGSQEADVPSERSVARENVFTRLIKARKRNKANESLINALYPNGINVYAGTSAKSMITETDKTLSTEEVEMAVETARLITRNGVSSKASDEDRKHIIWSLRTSFRVARTSIEVRALHAHSDWLRDHPGEALKLCKTIDNLIELDMVKNGGNDGIEHLDEYMAASMHPAFDSFEIIHIWRKDFLNAAVRYPDRLDSIVPFITSRKGFEEDGFEEYMSAAAKHPDKIGRMIDYITERGTFDEGGFEQYINAAAPLAEGTL